MPQDSQPSLFSHAEIPPAPAASGSLSALDELFLLAGHYRKRTDYKELLEFIARFRTYSPYNAMLIHTQMKGAMYVAPPWRWLDKYRRRIRPGARPIVILRPKGPVLFVFDVSDTEPMVNAPRLPRSITNPFQIERGRENGQLAKTIDNARRDGVRVETEELGSQMGGFIRVAEEGNQLRFTLHHLFKDRVVTVPLRYELILSARQSPEEQYATLVHELGHLYCGHLGTPNPRWWPSRIGLAHNVRECEAESVAYLVCRRLGIEVPAAEYVAGYLGSGGETPPISLDVVMKAASRIQEMGKRNLPLRKDSGE